MAQLRILIPQLLEIIAYTRIIVDGIDECTKENQKAILKELENSCTGPSIRCKVLYASRKEVHIYKKLSEQPQISLDGRQEVDWDIKSFVSYKMSKLQAFDQELLMNIESMLVEKANGEILRRSIMLIRLTAQQACSCGSD
jgi:hypothetical protein